MTGKKRGGGESAWLTRGCSAAMCFACIALDVVMFMFRVFIRGTRVGEGGMRSQQVKLEAVCGHVFDMHYPRCGRLFIEGCLPDPLWWWLGGSRPLGWQNAVLRPRALPQVWLSVYSRCLLGGAECVPKEGG